MMSDVETNGGGPRFEREVVRAQKNLEEAIFISGFAFGFVLGVGLTLVGLIILGIARGII